MNATYAIGTLITLQGTFRDAGGALTDPTTVECEVRTPDRAVSKLTAVRQDVGVYQATYTPTMLGGHTYKFQGIGDCQVSAFGDFQATGGF